MGVRVPLRSRHFLSQKLCHTFTRTSVGMSKMNAVARAHLTLRMLTFLQKYLSHLVITIWINLLMKLINAASDLIFKKDPCCKRLLCDGVCACIIAMISI